MDSMKLSILAIRQYINKNGRLKIKITNKKYSDRYTMNIYILNGKVFKHEELLQFNNILLVLFDGYTVHFTSILNDKVTIVIRLK